MTENSGAAGGGHARAGGASGGLRALTVRQPYAWAIASGYKLVENRPRPLSYRGLLAIHAAKGFNTDDRDRIDPVAERAGVLRGTVAEGAEVRGAVVAVAQLVGMCSEARRYSASRPLACGCGRWAANGWYHLLLAEVHALPEPVACKGALSLWRLPREAVSAVVAQVPAGFSIYGEDL